MTHDNDCFCDLAPLYALDLLCQQDTAWVEQQVADCPDLAEELADYEAAVTALAYSAPPQPMADDLKTRLFDRLGLELSGEVPSEPLPKEFLAVRSQDLKWQPHLIPGVQIAILHTDEVKREIVGFLKAEPGVRYPYHRHAATEELFMLEGDLLIANEVFGPGDYIRSRPGSAHAPYTHGGCRFFFRASMDNEYPEETAVLTS
jgi:hypothetical protein